MADEKFLRQIGATSEVPPDDPHAGCLKRWLDERDRREVAERSIQANAQAYEKINEAQERHIAKLSLLNWCLLAVAIIAGVVAVVRVLP